MTTVVEVHSRIVGNTVSISKGRSKKLATRL